MKNAKVIQLTLSEEDYNTLANALPDGMSITSFTRTIVRNYLKGLSLSMNKK